ncbi:hypothetical protein R4I97_02400 [Brachyspira pilosicoli]|uniref:hypothetical protein n=1 Tax=Brachyspira pilosicoli TaxID=52584 RepID=UPI003006E42A
MSKRVLRLVSILFLSSILVLSCSNANKTGSGDNNSGNGGTGGTGDGGTTPTPQGIAKYAGTWTAKFSDVNSYEVIIGNDGTVTIDDGSLTKKEATDITENGNTYTMKIKRISDENDTITITFNDGTSGTITDSSEFWGTGIIRKQNGGNKGLWYYEGTWTLTPNQQQGQANMTMTIKNDGTIDLNIGAEQQTSINDITDKGNEIYEVKFTPNGPDSSVYILTLKFINDNSGSFTLSISDNPESSGSGNMSKQKQ